MTAAPPGADVLELAIDFLWPCYLDAKLPKMDFAARDPQCRKLARALQQYGDERAAAAREAAIEEATTVALDNPSLCGWDLAFMIRALAAKPGSASDG